MSKGKGKGKAGATSMVAVRMLISLAEQARSLTQGEVVEVLPETAEVWLGNKWCEKVQAESVLKKQIQELQDSLATVTQERDEAQRECANWRENSQIGKMGI